MTEPTAPTAERINELKGWVEYFIHLKIRPCYTAEERREACKDIRALVESAPAAKRGGEEGQHKDAILALQEVAYFYNREADRNRKDGALSFDFKKRERGIDAAIEVLKFKPAPPFEPSVTHPIVPAPPTCPLCNGLGQVNAVPNPAPPTGAGLVFHAWRDGVWLGAITDPALSDRVFIAHIQSHLKEGEKVVCKICGRTAEEIAGPPAPPAKKKPYVDEGQFYDTPEQEEAREKEKQAPADEERREMMEFFNELELRTRDDENRTKYRLTFGMPLASKIRALILAPPVAPARVTREQLESAIETYHITGPHSPFILEEDIPRFLYRLGVVIEDGEGK